MNMSSLGVLVTNRRAWSAVLDLLSLPLLLLRRRKPPPGEIGDHLRRDVGLPPLDDANGTNGRKDHG